MNAYVLINPAMQPWRLFEFIRIEQIPLKVTDSWTLDADQLQQLQSIADTKLKHADRLFVLLQRGDGVLDYRQHNVIIMQHSHLH